jgi:UDP-glucose 4-epimerase
MSFYLVTGGCGFIGSHLCDLLIASGHKVRVLDDLSTGKKENLPPDVELQIGDITNPQHVHKAMENVEGCFHLAAIASVQKSNEEWIPTHQTNLTGTIHILDAARKKPGNSIPVVYVSSAAIYGDNPNLPLSEDSLPKPLTAYGADKLGCEHHARVAALVHKIPTIGFRLFNIYGPRQDPASPYSGVISIFMDKIVKRAPLTIFGDGQQNRDFVFVKDVILYFDEAMKLLKKSSDPNHGVYNICRGQKITITTLAENLGQIAGYSPKIIYTSERPGDIKQSQGSTLKLHQQFGFKAETELKDGLSETYAFFRTHDGTNLSKEAIAR